MAKARKLTGVEPLRSYRENARIILPQKVEEVWTWEPFIRDAARREELHNMRISIKRLRYTMEQFRVAYANNRQQESLVTVRNTHLRYAECQRPITDSRYVEFLAVIVDLQEILGDVHDCDVVLDVLTDYTNAAEAGRLAPGVATLIARTQETRKADYETFLRKWEHLSEIGFKQQLLSFLAE